MNLKKFFEGEKFFCHMWSALVGGLLGRLGEGLECPSVWFPKAGPPPPTPTGQEAAAEHGPAVAWFTISL